MVIIMKNRTTLHKSAFLLVIAFFLMCIPAYAVDANVEHKEYDLNFTGIEGLSNIQSINEYDVIVGIRQLTNVQRSALNLSQEDLSYIMSDEIEEEISYRSTLSDAELSQVYGYSEDTIGVLREYNGEKLETNPSLRAVSSVFSLGSDILTYGSSRMGMLFGWQWSSPPICSLQDIIAITWDGTYANGLTNNIALNRSLSFVNVEYKSTTTSVSRYNLSTTEPYHNASLRFSMDSPSGAPLYWAQSGAAFVYVDTVNSSPSLTEVSFRCEYGHQTIAGISSVSFPLSIGISFNYCTTSSGAVVGRLKSNGTWLPY